VHSSLSSWTWGLSSVQGGDFGAGRTVIQKDVGAFGTIEQKDVVAAGTIQKCWFCQGKGSTTAVNPQSSVISPGVKVIDPRFGVGDDRSAGDIPSSPGCAASRTHEHTPDGAVPSGMVSEPEVKKIPPGYMIYVW